MKDEPLTEQTRTETDSLGTAEVPVSAYWGIHTASALENFPIAERPISIYPEFLRALACMKQAAARANLEIGVLDRPRAALIDRACGEIIQGGHHDQFVVGASKVGPGRRPT